MNDHLVLARPDADQWPRHPAAELFPMLDGDDLHALADDIAEHGLREPVWLWDDPERGEVLLDGRNRLAACRLAGVHVKSRRYKGDNPLAFVISENVRRRHLTTGQLAAIGARAEPMFAEQAAKRMLAGKAPDDPVNPGADLHQGLKPKKKRAPRAADEAAKSAGTSGRAVAQYKRVAEAAPDLAGKVDSGEMALDRAERIVRDRVAEQKRVEEARAAAPDSVSVDLRVGDFREVLADLRDVDAIITDPPYGVDVLDLLPDLAAWADKVLAPDGVMAILIGQTHLPAVFAALDGYRPYRWTACYHTTGPAYVSQARHVQSQWKPLLVYGAGPRFSDVITSTGDSGKTHHKWGQNFEAFSEIIRRLTKSAATVVDPFCGGGTTLLAAFSLGRHAIGADIDPEAIATAQSRFDG